MPKRPELPQHLYPKEVDSCFLKPVVPEITAAELALSLLVLEERASLRTPTPGNVTILLSYKNKDGAIISYLADEGDLQILQLQGARSRKAYRVYNGVKTVALFAQETSFLAQHTSWIERISMPIIDALAGIDAVEAKSLNSVYARYTALQQLLGLEWSASEQLFVADVKKDVIKDRV